MGCCSISIRFLGLTAAATITLFTASQWIVFRQVQSLATVPGFESEVRRAFIGSGREHRPAAVDGEDFDGVLWPRLQEQLCPRGLPHLPLGPTLFRLAREELGIRANAAEINKANRTAASSWLLSSVLSKRAKRAKRNNATKGATSTKDSLMRKFFDGPFDRFAVVVDHQDPGSSLLYVPIWKCANSQIRSYLRAHFKLQHPEQNPHEKRPSSQRWRPRRTVAGSRRALEERGRHLNGSSTSTGQQRNPQGRHSSLRHRSTHLGRGRPEHGNGRAQSRAVPERRDRQGSKEQWWKSNGSNNGTAAQYAYKELAAGREFSEFWKRYTAGPSVPRDEKPCVFTAIRDPISHFISGYNEVENRLLTKEVKFRSRHPGSLPSYSQLPHGNSKDSAWFFETREDSRALRQIRFETFVRDLLEEHASFGRDWWHAHIFPMSRVLHTLQKQGLLPPATAPSSGGDNQWIIPTIANITDTLPRFLDRQCPRFAARYPGTGRLPPVEVAGVHKSRDDPFGTHQAAEDVWRRGGAMARSLCRLLAFDYACFYGAPGRTSLGGAGDIPATCRDVYASAAFREGIKG